MSEKEVSWVVMSFRNLVFVLLLLVCVPGMAFAQSYADSIIVPLTVEEGFPLEVVLTTKLRFKENEKVQARVVEPVFAFDREVIPAGSLVSGRITGFRAEGKWKRALTMLSGDFTPKRDPQITLDTLTFPDGHRMRLEAIVVAGSETVLRVNTESEHGGKLKKSIAPASRVSRTERFKDVLWGLSPYRPQYSPKGTHFTALLQKELDFGSAVFWGDALADIGSKPPAGSIVAARLMTPLDSRFSGPGTSVESILTRPLFSSEGRLLFPAGSRLYGEVLDASEAGKWHRHGQLNFKLTSIEPPALFGELPKRDIASRLVGMQVTKDMDDVRINADGVAQISESKKRFIAPAYAMVKAGTSFGSTGDSFGQAVVGAYRSKLTKEIGGGSPGLGLTGSITGAMVPPVGIGLGVFRAARSIYSNFIGRGQDIVLPVNSLLEIQLQ